MYTNFYNKNLIQNNFWMLLVKITVQEYNFEIRISIWSFVALSRFKRCVKQY